MMETDYADLAALIAVFRARLGTGVLVVGDRPYIHGVPAALDPEPPLLPEVLSPWRCPHCNAHLAVDGHICLNGCHLTAPQYHDFQARIREASFIVERGQRLLSGLRFSTFPEGYNGYRKLLVERHEGLRGDHALAPVITAWMREQSWRGHVGVSDRDTHCHAVFDDEADRMLFVLRWKGEAG